MKLADLHLHTHFSDGTYTAGELIAAAEMAGLSCIAVVDHDTVEGIGPVISASLGKDIEVLPGIELTAEYEGLEIHILGYLVDYNDISFLKTLSTLRSSRVERIYKIVEKLKKMGIDLNPQAVFDIGGCGTVGRLHIARAMLKENIISSFIKL